jgi:SAM-dependent methyltransferase
LLRGTDRLYHTTTDSFYVVECKRCHLIRLFPQPTPWQLRHYYPPSYWFEPSSASLAARLEEQYRRWVLRDHVRFVRKALEGCSEGLVLDVGCGGGLFLRMLREHGFRVAGLDFALDAAAAAWRTQSVPVVCSSLTRAPLRPQSCAGVTMFHVLEHLYDPAAHLRAAHRLLRPDGKLVVQVPNAGCWQFLLLGESWNGLDIPRHLFNFRESDLEVLLRHTGFEIVRRKHFSLRDNPAGLATSLVPSLDPMARRVREIHESPNRKLFRDLLYLALVMAAVPLTAIEAMCGAGSTIMIEARKKA